MRFARRAFLLSFLVASPLLAAEDDYVIRLSRPTRVGDRYRLDAKGTTQEHEKISMGGQVQNEDKDMSVHLIAVATVLAVDSSSAATKTEYLIELCRKTSSGKTEDVLSEGRKVVVEADEKGDTTYTVDGDPALDDIQKSLSVVLSAHRPNSPSDDDIFGTKDRKRVGDTWSINSVAAAADLSKAGLTVSPEAFKGTVSFDGVRTVGTIKALELSARLRAEGMTMSGEDLPDWLHVEKSSLTGEMSALVPADPDVPNPFPDKVKMQIVIVLKGQKPDTGSVVTIEETIDMSLEKSYPPMARPETASEDQPIAVAAGSRR
jgi:hypothetical protein